MFSAVVASSMVPGTKSMGVPYEDGSVDSRDGPGGGSICECMSITTKDLCPGIHGAPGPALVPSSKTLPPVSTLPLAVTAVSTTGYMVLCPSRTSSSVSPFHGGETEYVKVKFTV